MPLQSNLSNPFHSIFLRGGAVARGEWEDASTYLEKIVTLATVATVTNDGSWEDLYYPLWQEWLQNLTGGIAGLIHAPQKWAGRRVEDPALEDLGRRVPDSTICRLQFIRKPANDAVNPPYFRHVVEARLTEFCVMEVKPNHHEFLAALDVIVGSPVRSSGDKETETRTQDQAPEDGPRRSNRLKEKAEKEAEEVQKSRGLNLFVGPRGRAGSEDLDPTFVLGARDDQKSKKRRSQSYYERKYGHMDLAELEELLCDRIKAEAHADVTEQAERFFADNPQRKVGMVLVGTVGTSWSYAPCQRKPFSTGQQDNSGSINLSYGSEVDQSLIIEPDFQEVGHIFSEESDEGEEAVKGLLRQFMMEQDNEDGREHNDSD